MAKSDKSPQGRRTERVTLAVTPEERTGLAVVASAKGVKGDSVLLRTMSLRDVMREYRRLRALLGGAGDSENPKASRKAA